MSESKLFLRCDSDVSTRTSGRGVQDEKPTRPRLQFLLRHLNTDTEHAFRDGSHPGDAVARRRLVMLEATSSTAAAAGSPRKSFHEAGERVLAALVIPGGPRLGRDRPEVVRHRGLDFR